VKLHGCSTRTSIDAANVSRQFAAAIKMNFRKRFGLVARGCRPAVRRERTLGDIGPAAAHFPKGTLTSVSRLASGRERLRLTRRDLILYSTGEFGFVFRSREFG
jgi:hypothetical protein